MFITDGQGNATLTQPLVDIRFSGMVIDFFASIDEQYVRVFTVVADEHLPLDLQATAMGELAPVFGNIDDAFTNLWVKRSEAEPPADLAARPNAGRHPTLSEYRTQPGAGPRCPAPGGPVISSHILVERMRYG